ncbi:MAG: hypothetical protein H0X24_01570 [Ktedonobacterales bacterium]|nr:hypothetical protein [Ktedonobacterales bacterium]
MTTPEPHWQPISQLPRITDALDGMLESATENLTMLRQARPGSLDDATVARVISVYTTQRDDLWLYTTQLQRWQAETRTPAQRAEIARLTGQLARLGDTLTTVLDLAEQLKATTIETILGKSDLEVGLDFLLCGGRFADDE